MIEKSEHQIDCLTMVIWNACMGILIENLLNGKLAWTLEAVPTNVTKCPEYVSLAEDISTTKTPIK